MFVRESIEGSTEDPEKVRDFAYRHEVDIDDKKEIYFVVIERMHVFSRNMEMLKPRKSSESPRGKKKASRERPRADDKRVNGKWNNKKASEKENVIKSRSSPDVARA